MKAIKIDVTNQTISQITIGKDYKEIYTQIGNNCDLFCCPFEFENGDCLYADDEALLKEVEGCFAFPNWNYPIVGNAIILGTDYDNDGESTDAKSEISQLQETIIWGNKAVAEMYQDYASKNTPDIISF